MASDSVGKAGAMKGTNQFMRTGQTSGKFGNDPSATGINGVGNPKDAIKELKA